MYSIGQFAKKTGLTIRTLRYYDEKNLLKPAMISPTGQRFYDDSNLVTAQKIVTFKFLDFTVEEIRQLLQDDLPLLASFQQQKAMLEQKQQHLTRIIASLDTAISILDKTSVQEPTLILLVLHTLFTEDQQRTYLKQFLPESIVEELYDLLGTNLVDLNRQYIEAAYAIKVAYAQQLPPVDVQPLIMQLFDIIPVDLRMKIALAVADVEMEQPDDWLFPSPFTQEEEAWLLEQVTAMEILGGQLNETPDT